MGPVAATAGAVACPAVYRRRNPERTAFYQLLEQHFDDYVYAYEERYEPKAGPLRPVVRPTVEAFLGCGRLHGGFARIRCPSCKDEHLLCFFLPDEKFLLLLPGEALRLVRRKTPRTDPTAGPSSTLHLYNPEGPPRTFRARTPLALPSLANRLRERPRVFPGALPA